MAQSRRKESIRQLVTELECAFYEDPTHIPADDELVIGRPGPEESLDLGHARLHSECWGRSPRTALRRARKRTPLHLARPASAADARFTPGDGEFLD